MNILYTMEYTNGLMSFSINHQGVINNNPRGNINFGMFGRFRIASDTRVSLSLWTIYITGTSPHNSCTRIMPIESAIDYSESLTLFSRS